MRLILFLDLFYRFENQSHTASKWQSQNCILAVSGGAHDGIQHAMLPPIKELKVILSYKFFIIIICV